MTYHVLLTYNLPDAEGKHDDFKQEMIDIGWNDIEGIDSALMKHFENNGLYPETAIKEAVLDEVEISALNSDVDIVDYATQLNKSPRNVIVKRYNCDV
jgi:hypothetical protein